MKNKLRIVITVMCIFIMMVCGMLTGCSKTEENPPEEKVKPGTNWEAIPEETPTPEPEEVPEEEVEETVEGCYRSELTNEWIDEGLKDQRPLAVMVDNEKTALDHFGTNSADIVYEIMNSTLNARITRLMCIVKDYNSIEQFGSVRSTRPTNFMLAGEYNAILIHDGGPFYNDEYYAKDYVNNLSGGFARFINGKSLEFTEYVTPEEYTNSKGKTYDGVNKRIEDAGYSKTYTELYEGPHFQFSNDDFKLSDSQTTVPATHVALPFEHNSSELKYNEETGTYDYYEYGAAHVDALDGNKVTSFKNAIIYSCSFTQLDENGYLIYNIIGSGENGYFLTNGEAIPIAWVKGGSEYAQTKYINLNTGEDIVLNTGKTYISIVPEDSWDKLIIE